MEEPRVKAFRALKPPCVELSQLALQYKAKKTSSKDVIKSLEFLLETLRTVSQQADALDSKLAEYAFFPLSHIFRDTKDLPVRAVELALQCLQILISKGWRANLSSDLGKQLLILLSFLAGGSATDAKVKEVNEELGTAAFDCLAALFEATKYSFLGSRVVSSQDVPVLGHAVTVMLDGVSDSPSLGVRLAALKALDNLISGITDDEALKNVFPGIVSSLTRVLSSKAVAKPSFRVLTASLATLTKILCKVINDNKNEHPNNGQSEAVAVIKNDNERDEKKSWVTATAAQVKMALANIIPLRYHERSEVRATLFQLCISVIQHCRRSLSQSIPMLIDTLIVLRSQPSEAERFNIFTLDSLLAADADLLEIVKTSLHDWIVGLPRVMQANDDTRKRRTIEQISTGFKILQNQDIRLNILNDSMTANLRASVSAAIQASSQIIRPVSERSLEIGQLMQPNARSQSTSFSPVLFNESSSRDTITGLQKLAVQLKDLSMSTSLQQGLTNTLRNTSGDEQLASLWLSVQLLNNALSEMSAMDQFLNLPAEHGAQEQFLDDVYSFSLDVLGKSTFEDEDRWKLQCLALETVAQQAQHQKYDFRPELVDALYPILERLGSNNSTLQHHAMTCLNIVSTACSYSDPATLIIDNADYLVNAIALKLNTFDISPQAPQVLVMMTKLCGSSLIPYLDDLVESIFSILACYHGYPALVSSLFSVLNAIVEEASKAPTPTITENQTRDSLRPKIYKPTTIPSLASLLRSNLEQSTRPLSSPPSPPPEQEEENKDPTNEEVEPTSPPRPSTPPPPHPSKTHTLLTSITTLTPSHLTTPSPSLRLSLLSLLATAIPILASNGTDTFLPIAATLYPALTTRLFSFNSSKEEGGGGEGVLVVTAAANTLRVLCECAGDFLFSRVEEDWAHLEKLYERVERGMREEVRVLGRGKGKGRERGGKEIVRQGPKGLKWRAWDAVVRLILVLVREVGVNFEMEDGVFEMLGEWAGERRDVRDVLEEVNADALWLVELREGRIEGLVRPQGVEGVEFRDVALSLDK